MLRGSHVTRVDEKGRLKLPAEFKRWLEEKYGGNFYITSRDGLRAQIYPMPEWEKFEAQLAEIPDFDPAKSKLQDLLSYYGQTAEMDPQGRVLIPQILREAASVSGDVLVIGKGSYLEVANHENFKANLEQNRLTLDDRMALAKYKLG
jgi:MraZ protein